MRGGALLFLSPPTHIAAAEAAAQAAAPAAALAALAATPAADPRIHGSISFIMNHKPKKIKNLQTAEKSRGWLEIGRLLDQIDRVDANYFSKIFERTSKRTNEQNNRNKQENFEKNIHKKIEKHF